MTAAVTRHGSARKASLAYGFEANFLSAILRDPNRIPDVETLDRVATAFGWDLCDVIKWALGREGAEQPPPRARLAAALDDLGLDGHLQKLVADLVDNLM